jgi:hypothetical protein
MPDPLAVVGAELRSAFGTSAVFTHADDAGETSTVVVEIGQVSQQEREIGARRQVVTRAVLFLSDAEDRPVKDDLLTVVTPARYAGTWRVVDQASVGRASGEWQCSVERIETGQVMAGPAGMPRRGTQAGRLR